MSHYLVEPYTPNAACHALPATQRQQFLGHIGSALTQLSSLGVEVLSLAETDPGMTRAAHTVFLASGASLPWPRGTPCWPASRPAAGTAISTT